MNAGLLFRLVARCRLSQTLWCCYRCMHIDKTLTSSVDDPSLFYATKMDQEVLLLIEN